MLLWRLRHTGYHGTSGPMKIADLQLTPLVEAFLDAGRELSYEVLDVNGATMLGEPSWCQLCYVRHKHNILSQYQPAMARVGVRIKVRVSVLVFGSRTVNAP